MALSIKNNEFLNNLPIGIYKTNAEGKILFANQALARILGYHSLDELATANVEGIFVSHQMGGNDIKIYFWNSPNEISI